MECAIPFQLSKFSSRAPLKKHDCLTVCLHFTFNNHLLVGLSGRRVGGVGQRERTAEGVMVISISFGVGLAVLTETMHRLVPNTHSDSNVDLHKGPKKTKKNISKCAYDLLSFWVQENLQKKTKIQR